MTARRRWLPESVRRDGVERQHDAVAGSAYADFETRWTHDGTFVTGISRVGDDVSALALSPRPFPRAFVPDAPTTGAASLPGGGYRPLAQAEHVAVEVLEPRTARRTLVFLERDTPRGQVANDGLQVVDLEVSTGWYLGC